MSDGFTPTQKAYLGHWKLWLGVSIAMVASGLMFIVDMLVGEFLFGVISISYTAGFAIGAIATCGIAKASIEVRKFESE